MPEAVIETKLLLPRLRQRLVARPRLDDQLRRGAETTLTLLAAPAGFGKTTVLAEWLGHRGGCAVAWVSLDERDTDASVFWTHVLHAVDRAVPGAAMPAIARLGADRAQVEEALALLVNELGVATAGLSVVLDDYHLAESSAVQRGMSFLLEHLPPQVHLVISTRVDPGLPLARMRVRGQLVEIRAADLRFTADEAAAYLNDVNALDLRADDVATLERRTEGWAAALQLAALSLQGKDDPAGFIAGFAGDNRFVVDYLADEVLDRQPGDVRDFLLQTAVLDELTAPSCDAVTGRTDSAAMLEQLERQNLFLVPLDDQRRRYRYHHLFADVLRAHLLEEQPGRAAQLHRRASDWYHGADDPEGAVRHAVASGDLRLAADRVELAAPALLRARREAVLRRWAHELPADIVQNRPVLAVGFIGGLMSSNDFAEVPGRLEYVQSLLGVPVDDLVVADARELARLPAAVEIYRAGLALVDGEPGVTAHHAELALAHAAPDDHLSTASASALLGLASWADGDLETAHGAYRTASDHLELAGHVADVLGCSIPLADLDVTLGRLTAARRTLEAALALADDRQMPGVSDVHVGLSRIAWERGDLESMADCLRRADESGEACGLPQYPYRWRVMMARLRHAQGDTATAVELLEQAHRVYVGDFLPDVQPVAATRARFLAESGDVRGALTWAGERGVTAADDLTYLREYEHLTLARVLLAQHAAAPDERGLAEVTDLLSRISTAAGRGGRTATVIETLVLRAVAHRAAGRLDAAIDAVAEAAELAQPEGFVRVFTEEGAVAEELLAAALERDPTRRFVQQLLHASAARAVPGGATPRRAAPDHGLVEPLSSREIDVLRLLGSELSGPEIARHLQVSLATVRTHTQHVYAKLGVNNRRAAVRRAHQLDLFPRYGR